MNNKSLLIFGIILCLYISVSKIYETAMDMIPIAKPGECITVNFVKSHATKFKVLENNKKTHSSKLIRRFDEFTMMEYNLEYSEMRKLNAKKVDCNEPEIDIIIVD